MFINRRIRGDSNVGVWSSSSLLVSFSIIFFSIESFPKGLRLPNGRGTAEVIRGSLVIVCASVAFSKSSSYRDSHYRFNGVTPVFVPAKDWV